MVCVKKVPHSTIKTKHAPARTIHYYVNPYDAIVKNMGPACYRAYQEKKVYCSDELCCRKAFPSDILDKQTRGDMATMIETVQRETDALNILDSCAKYTFLRSDIDDYTWLVFCRNLQLIIFRAECILNQCNMIHRPSDMGAEFSHVYIEKIDAAREPLHKIIAENQRILELPEEEVRRRFTAMIRSRQKEMLKRIAVRKTLRNKE